METRVNMYKLFQNSKDPIPIHIPITLIKGHGFDEATLISNNSLLTFTPLSPETAYSKLKYLFSVHKILFKSETESKILTKLPESLGEEWIYQVCIEGKKILARWSFKSGYLDTTHPMNLRIQLEHIKEIINKELKAPAHRLSTLCAEFIISQDLTAYWISVKKYSYTMSKPVSRMHSFDTLQSVRPRNAAKKNKKMASEVVSPISSLYKNPISDDISEIMKGSESVKYMRYNQWRNRVDRGEKLLSNELLYGKKIAGISTRVLVKSSNSIKDLRRMNSDLRNTIIAEEFIMNRNTRLAHRIAERKIENYRITLKPIVTHSRKLSVITEELVVDRIFNQAVRNLEAFKRKSVT